MYLRVWECECVKSVRTQHEQTDSKELWECPRCHFVECSCLWIIKGVPWMWLFCWSLARRVCRGVTEKTSLIPFDVPLGCVYWIKMKNLVSQSGTLLTYSIILSWQAFASEFNSFFIVLSLFLSFLESPSTWGPCIFNNPIWWGKHMFST